MGQATERTAGSEGMPMGSLGAVVSGMNDQWRRSPPDLPAVGSAATGSNSPIGALAPDATVRMRQNEPDGGSVLCPGAAVENFFGPLVIVSSDLVAVSCNAAARSVLERADRIAIRPDGRFSVYPNSLDTKLKKIVRSLVSDPAADGEGRTILVCGRSGRPSHVVVASPLVPDEGRVARVLLTIVEFGASEDSVSRSILDAFGLTERECEFVEHFVRGCSVDEASVLMRISKNTGRVHLRNVIVKTGARNQVDLLRRIMRFPAMVGTPRFRSAPA